MTDAEWRRATREARDFAQGAARFHRIRSAAPWGTARDALIADAWECEARASRLALRRGRAARGPLREAERKARDAWARVALESRREVTQNAGEGAADRH